MKFTLTYNMPSGMDIMILSNSKEIKAKQVNNGQRIEYNAVGNVVKVRFKSFHELESQRWILKTMFFWIIGVFGIFTPSYGKYFPKVDFVLEFNITSDESTAFVSFMPVRNDSKMISISRLKDCTVTGDNDLKYEINFDIQKRAKTVRRLSRLARWISVAAIVFLTIKLIQ